MLHWIPVDRAWQSVESDETGQGRSVVAWLLMQRCIPRAWGADVNNVSGHHS